MRILIAQINPIVGDLAYNEKLVLDYLEKGRKQKVDLILFPELTLTGYPPEDLLFLPKFLETVSKTLDRIVKKSKDLALVIGLPRQDPNHPKIIYNSAAVIENGLLKGFVDKMLLPTYDVFDERRYFKPSTKTNIWRIKEHKVAITICEDIWQHGGYLTSMPYDCDPIEELKKYSPDLMVNLSASPYHFGKFAIRTKVCLAAAKTLNCPVILCNQVGANDSLIFDGYSLCVSPKGLLKNAKGFEEDALVFDTAEKNELIHLHPNELEDLYKALVLGVRDYFEKQGFKKACIGLSGGIDSALVACIAKDALGKDNVLTLFMPSRYTSEQSANDSEKLAHNLGVEYKTLSIENPFESYLDLLSFDFAGLPINLAEENLQARIRGMLLMAFSNKFGYIVLSTGNKSEMAMGYSTLYGDMCGGLCVIGDINKTQVFKLCHWINREKEIIPRNILVRPPSAELRYDQKDSDSLPEYEILDKILTAYIEEHHSPQQIAEEYRYSLELVNDVIKRVHMNEYKRRQAPPGLRVSGKSFSIGRRFPIVQGWV